MNIAWLKKRCFYKTKNDANLSIYSPVLAFFECVCKAKIQGLMVYGLFFIFQKRWCKQAGILTAPTNPCEILWSPNSPGKFLESFWTLVGFRFQKKHPERPRLSHNSMDFDQCGPPMALNVNKCFFFGGGFKHYYCTGQRCVRLSLSANEKHFLLSLLFEEDSHFDYLRSVLM